MAVGPTMRRILKLAYNATKNALQVDQVITKTVQTELLAPTSVVADTQQLSSVLDLSGQTKRATIFIDHGRTATTAFVGAGTEYRVEVSQQASGDDTWVSIASVVCDITAASQITADGNEAIGQTVVETGATQPAVGDYIFWQHTTIANSIWGKVVARVTTGGSESFTLQDALRYAQLAAQSIYNKAERFALSLDVKGYTRLRVVVNNNNGTTNVAVVSRIACITQN